MDPAVIEKAKTDLAAPTTDPAIVIRSLREELDRYNSQFVEEKRILYERQANPTVTGRRSVNSLRLYYRNREKETARLQNPMESPVLFEIHTLLGEAHERLQEKEHALQNYLEALRYSGSGNPGDDVSKRNAELAYRIVGLVRQKEDENERLARYLHRSSYYRGIGQILGADRTNKRNHTGSMIFLDYAGRLDPQNRTYAGELAEELERDGQIVRAIDYEEIYLDLAEKQNATDKEKAPHYRNLAGLYHASKNDLKAAQYYELYVSSDATDVSDAEDRNEARFHLAEIHFLKTGRIDRSKTLYEEYLKNDSASAQESWKKKALRNSRLFQIQDRLAHIHMKQQRSGNALKSMQEAIRIYRELEQVHGNTIDDLEQLKKRMNELAVALREKEDEGLQSEYYRIKRIRIPEIRVKEQFLYSRLKSLPAVSLMEKEAAIQWKLRNYTDALDLYGDIMKRGDGVQVTRARENIARLEQVRNSGVMREPVPYP